MAENQNDLPDLNGMINEIMNEYASQEEEVHLEPQPKEVTTAEPRNQLGMEEPVEEERATKEQKTVRRTEEEETEDNEAFISDEAHAIWNKQFDDKGFVSERGFGKLISPFSEIIEKRGWEFFCAHKAPGFAALAREFYANMVGIREDSVYVRGVWVPFGHRKINEILQLKELKHGSKFKKMVENPDHEKILNLLTAGKGKWEATKKNPHHAINRGSLTEEAKVWFYFICSVVIPTKHMCSIREQEAMILYALLKGYKMNIGIMIKGSIKGYHLSNKRGLIPHPVTISKLCILVGVRGSWEEKETCPKASSLTLTGVTKGPKNKKEMGMVEVETEPAEENDNREMETVPEQIPPAEEEEIPLRMSPLSHSGFELREDFPEQA